MHDQIPYHPGLAARWGWPLPPMAGGSDVSTGAAAAPTGAEGEGGGEAQPGLGLYDLSGAPEELRPYLEAELKKYDGNVTKKFQEHADFRKRYEPYQEVDFGDVPADELKELIEFRQVLQDPEQFKEWLGAVSQEVGLGAGPSTPEEWLALGEQEGWIDAEGNVSEGDGQPPAWAQELREQVEALGGTFKEFQGKTEAEQSAAQQSKAFADRLGELEISEEDRPLVIQEAHLFIKGDDPIGKAWEHVQKLRGTAEGDALQERLDRNGDANGALPAGQINSQAESMSFDDPRLKQAALARMKQGT